MLSVSQCPEIYESGLSYDHLISFVRRESMEHWKSIANNFKKELFSALEDNKRLREKYEKQKG